MMKESKCRYIRDCDEKNAAKKEETLITSGKTSRPSGLQQRSWWMHLSSVVLVYSLYKPRAGNFSSFFVAAFVAPPLQQHHYTTPSILDINNNVHCSHPPSQQPKSSSKKKRRRSRPIENAAQKKPSKQHRVVSIQPPSVQTLLEQFCSDPRSSSETILAACTSPDDYRVVLDWMASSSTSRLTYRACLQAAGDPDCTHTILAAMQEANRLPSVEEYAVAIRTFCHGHKWRAALHLQHQHSAQGGGEDLPLAIYNTLLSCLADKRRWKEAVQLLKSMERNPQTSPSLTSYRSVVECCTAAKQPGLAVQFLQSCHDVSGLTPTTFLFSIVISSLSEQRQWRRCLQLLDWMDTLQVKKNLTIYNAVLTACSRAREPAQAKSLLLRMQRSDTVTPNIVSYNCVLAACASSASRWKDALQLLDQAHRQPGVTPDVYTYTNAIRACAKGRQRSRALTLLQVMKDKGLPLDVYTYTAAIEACDWKGALQLVNEMQDRGIEPSKVTYSVAIKACGASGQWQKALELLDSMRSKNMPINIYVYNAAITAVAKAAKQQQRRRSTRSATTERQQLYPQVEQLMTQMQAEGIEPDGFTYSTAISCCGQEGRWEEALAIMEQMRQGGPSTQPNKVAYTAAITSCGKAGQVDSAIALFEEMQQQGLSTDLVAYNALFAALRMGKRPDDAFRYWNRLVDVWKQNEASSPIRVRGLQQVSLQPDIITITE